MKMNKIQITANEVKGNNTFIKMKFLYYISKGFYFSMVGIFHSNNVIKVTL